MTDFAVVTMTPGQLDPSKRVHYSRGLVLGVDEFNQEQVYFIEKNRIHNRALHGYGTVSGLRVSREPGFEIRVSPGLAVDPRGREIRVGQDQCARLNAWLQSHRDEVLARATSSPDLLRLYVVLEYRECADDVVPIPGDACRTEDESMAPSRIAESFALSLRFDPPSQVEEDAVRRFGALLCSIEVTDEGAEFVTREELEALVRSLGTPGSPSMEGLRLRIRTAEAREFLRAAFKVWVTEVRPDLLDKGGPVLPGSVEMCESVSAPTLSPPAEDPAILLARLEFPLNASGLVEALESIAIHEEDRPYLLHTRLLQEWLMCGRCCRGSEGGPSPAPPAEEADIDTFATLFIVDETTVRAWIHHPVFLNLPDGAVKVQVDESALAAPSGIAGSPGTNVFDLSLRSPLATGSRVTVRFDADIVTESVRPFQTLSRALRTMDSDYLDREGSKLRAYVVADFPAAAAPAIALDDLTDVSVGGAAAGMTIVRSGSEWIAGSHGDLAGLAADDHVHYLLVNGSRALTGNLGAGGNKITGLGAATVNGDAVRFEQAVKAGDAAGGDLSGTYRNPSVAGLRGRAVSPAAPGANDVLTWDAPRAPPLPLVTITLLPKDVFEMWFHFQVPTNDILVKALTTRDFEVRAEASPHGSVTDNMSTVNLTGLKEIRANVWTVELAKLAAETSHWLRFRFTAARIGLSNPILPGANTLLKWIVRSGTSYEGLSLSGDKSTVTAFVRVPARV